MSNFKLWIAGAWRSRTMWLAAALVVVGACQVAVVITIAPAASTLGWLMIGAGVAVGALRSVTTTSIVGKVPGTGPAPNPTMGPPKP